MSSLIESLQELVPNAKVHSPCNLWHHLIESPSQLVSYEKEQSPCYLWHHLIESPPELVSYEKEQSPSYLWHHLIESPPELVSYEKEQSPCYLGRALSQLTEICQCFQANGLPGSATFLLAMLPGVTFWGRLFTLDVIRVSESRAMQILFSYDRIGCALLQI